MHFSDVQDSWKLASSNIVYYFGSGNRNVFALIETKNGEAFWLLFCPLHIIESRDKSTRLSLETM